MKNFIAACVMPGVCNGGNAIFRKPSPFAKVLSQKRGIFWDEL